MISSTDFASQDYEWRCGAFLPDDGIDDELDSVNFRFNPQVSKLDVFKIRTKQVGLVALAVITAIALSPILVPAVIVGGIALGGFKAITYLGFKFQQENKRLEEMRERATAQSYAYYPAYGLSDDAAALGE